MKVGNLNGDSPKEDDVYNLVRLFWIIKDSLIIVEGHSLKTG